MKVSILCPSLYPPLAERLIRSVHASHKPDGVEVEIVICSPIPTHGDGIVWVDDKIKSGNNPAQREAFKASSGDIVVYAADDFTFNPDWLEKSLLVFGWGRNTVLALDGGNFSAFGYRYAIIGMLNSATVSEHWNQYFPYVAHYGDPAICMEVWDTGGKVLPMPNHEGVVNWGLDRLGCGESGHKSSHFESDQARFIKDFGHMANGYDLTQPWQTWNGVYPCKHDI